MLTMADHSERGRVRVEQSRKRVRIMLGGVVVADTRRPLLVWEGPYYPTYYIPQADVAGGGLRPTGEIRHSPSRGDAEVLTVTAGDREALGAAWTYPDSPIPELREAVGFTWEAMDHWFEEDEEVYVHPRDPYTRVDILRSSREIRVEVDGVVVAQSVRATLLFETGLPVRTYLPRTDVRMDLLDPTSTTTRCPYKGTAGYWTVVLDGERHEDVAWSYPFPAAESVKIAGLIAFYDEKVDTYVDGELAERPRSPFSAA